MKWTYSIKNKITTALLLGLVMLITIILSIYERVKLNEIENSVSSIYEDRLMAESYIFQLYDISKREQDVIESLTDSSNSILLKQITELDTQKELIITQYENTYLTKNENITFEQLKINFQKTDIIKNEILKDPKHINSHENYKNQAIVTFTLLKELSKIQTLEGKILMTKSNSLIKNSLSISYFEVAFLICIALIIQALVFSSKSLKTIAKNNKTNLN